MYIVVIVITCDKNDKASQDVTESPSIRHLKVRNHIGSPVLSIFLPLQGAVGSCSPSA